MNSDELVVYIPMSTSNVDIVLNALSEKKIGIQKLYDDIYNITYSQVAPQLEVREENNQMENKIIVCKECGKEFEYTVGEQKFFEEKGFAAPVRCKECRAAKKARNEEKNKQTPDLDEMLKKFQGNTILF